MLIQYNAKIMNYDWIINLDLDLILFLVLLRMIKLDLIKLIQVHIVHKNKSPKVLKKTHLDYLSVGLLW